MRDKGKLVVASSLRVSARMGILMMLGLAAAFCYSFLVAESHALNAYTYSIQSGHHSFVFGGRWYFLAGAFLAFAMSMLSLVKANRLENEAYGV